MCDGHIISSLFCQYKFVELALQAHKSITLQQFDIILRCKLSIQQLIHLFVIIQKLKESKIQKQMEQILVGIGLTACILLNIVSSRYGYSNIITGDKDILLPFSSMLFLFYSLLIYLPDTHHKVIAFMQPQHASTHQQQQEQQQVFPYAFLITLISITTCIIIHRMYLFHDVESEEEALTRRATTGTGTQRGLTSSETASSKSGSQGHTKNIKNIEYRIQSQILKYFLSLAIGLQNIVGAFYITNKIDHSNNLQNQIIVFGLFSVIINFAYGYINGWSAVSKQLHEKLSNFINFGILIGYFLGLIVQNNLIMLILPCFCCGLMIYSSAMVCLPALYSNGENHTQDKFRYGSIFTALLLTVVYHPFCYLLRV